VLTVVATLSVTYEVPVGNPSDPGSISYSKSRQSSPLVFNQIAPSITLTVNQPIEDSVIVSGASGASVTASGTASSLTGAIQNVTWIVPDTGANGQTPQGAAFPNWTLPNIPVPQGIHAIRFTATDNRGNTNSQIVDVAVAEGVSILSLDPGSYLRALANFIIEPANNDGSSRVLISVPGGLRSAQTSDLQILNQFFQLDARHQEVYAAQLNQPLHQCRVAVEVLRQYLRTHLPAPAQTNALNLAQTSYCAATYRALLAQLGSSFEELRLARTYAAATPDPRQQMADRLGVDLNALNALLLDPDAATGAANACTEPGLERLFGYLDSTRLPLNGGPTIGDPQSQVYFWTLDGVDWGYNTDRDGLIYVSVSSSSIGLFSDSARTQQVASYNYAGELEVDLVSARNSGLTGTLAVNLHQASLAIEFSVVPQFLSWQLQHLRTLWTSQDFPAAPQPGARPIVDPDLLSRGDFKHPANNAAYTLYTARQTQIQNWLRTLQTARGTSLDFVLQAGIARTSADLLNLNQSLQSGQDVSAQLAALNLSFTAFNFLVRICSIPAASLLLSEWNEVFSILVQAQKQAQYGAWISAERAAVITLGPDFFSAPPRLPDLFATGVDEAGIVINEGATDPHWTVTPAATTAAGAFITNSGAFPLDPTGSGWILQSVSNLSRWISPHASEAPGELPGAYTYRTKFDLTGFDTSSAAISARVAFDDDLVAVLLNGQVIPGLVGVRGYGSFQTITIDAGFVAGPNTLDFVVNNLGTAQNPSGLRAELSWASTPVPLPLDPWRAPASARAAWETKLQSRMDDQQRLKDALQAAVLAAEEQTLPAFRDALILAASQISPFTGLSSTGLDANGVPIPLGSPDLSWRLTVNPAGAAGAAPVVTQTAPPGWLADTSAALWISPSASEVPGDASGKYTFATSFTMRGFSLNAQLQAQVAAANTVSAIRINSQPVTVGAANSGATTQINITQGLYMGLNQLEFDVTNNAGAPNPVGLKVAFTPTTGFVDAEWFSQTLCIDLTASPTKMTTRLTQAIESIQVLLAGVASGQFLQMSPSPELATWSVNSQNVTISSQTPSAHKANFEQEWTWMGSYASWRAAMLAFLYPENLLNPNLLPAFPRNGWPSYLQSTPAFSGRSGLVETLRTTGSLTPQLARAAARQYIFNLTSPTPDPPAYSIPAALQNFSYPDPATLDSPAWRQRTQGLVESSVAFDLVLFWEVLYFVPVQIALQLQQSGQFEAALDWFAMVYDIRRPLTIVNGQISDDNRKTFYGLSQESGNNELVRIAGWLTELDNPHDIAAKRAWPYTRFTLLSIIECLLDSADAMYARESAESVSQASDTYLQALDLLGQVDALTPVTAGLDENPRVASLRQRAQNNLAQMQSNRNIAGLILPFQVFGPGGLETLTLRRASLAPSQYHYQTLIDRAKQLVTSAQQIETSYLGALANADVETYSLMKAQNDLGVAQANVTLVADQVNEASDSINVAHDQLGRARDEQSHYQDLINAGLNEQEQQALQAQQNAVDSSALGTVFSYMNASFATGSPFSALALGSLFGGTGQTYSARAQYLSTQASYERRQREWEYQLQLAKDDVQTTTDQVQVADDQLRVVKQQQQIATIQQTNAQDIVNFLANKFTSADLYDWMSKVLGQVYRYFLQQATSMARLAEDQLAFQRQQPALSVIQSDYRSPLSDSATASDRRGLTGAERLLTDITQLDQIAFSTDRRKLQLTRTFSLTQLDPFAFQMFVDSGVLVFSTPQSLFDQDFPGHYVRLISSVRVTLVALIPPAIGIRASLFNKGVSRVVASVPAVREVTVLRQPEVVALTSPLNASGVFDLDPQSQLLRPFENLGVDTSWRFEMPKAANPFDYASIFDILFSIDYTALDSVEYRGQVLQRLNQTTGADRGYSFSQDFADAWYNLNNPASSTGAVTVTFTTTAADFPPNVQSLQLAQLVLYFVRPSGVFTEFQVTDLQFTPHGSAAPIDGGAETTVNGVISTRRANGAGWKARFINAAAPVSPIGAWQLTLPSAPQQLQDILLVVSYTGTLPAWPN
jgi:hypothetical protein